MKAKGKLIGLLTALLCIVPMMTGLFGLGDSASAAKPDDITVTLHKKKMDEFPDGGIKNTGELIPEFENNYDPLPGVEFTVYDVTDDFYRLLVLTGNETPAQYKEKAEALLKTFQFSDVTDPDSKIKGQDVTKDPDGTVEFELKDRDEDGTYKVYLFKETDNSANEQFGQPVILMLPANKSGTEEANHDIHLYPKNRLENEPTKEVVEDDGKTPLDPTKDRYPFDVGKPITYKATFMIPNQIGEILKDETGQEIQTRYSKLVFKDEVDQDGVRFEGIKEIRIDDKKVDLLTFAPQIYGTITENNKGAEYAATGKKAGFEIKFNFNEGKNGVEQVQFNTSKQVAEHLSQWRGKKLEIVYSVILTDDTPVDIDINNDFVVDLTNKGKNDVKVVEDKPVVTTGGKKFKKHESTDDSQGLKGAEFVVTKRDPNDSSKIWYLKEGANKRTWAPKVDGYPDALKLVSKDEGLFEITGLEYGDYELVEIKAPNGFQKDPNPFKFKIDKDSYRGPDALLGGMVPNTTQGGFLPSTGGIGIVIFLVIGGSLMAFAYNRYRKTQHVA